MSRYDDIVPLMRSLAPESRLTPLQEAEVVSLKAKYPQLPADYVDYLQQIGWGGIGNSFYMIYSGLIEASEIYGAEASKDLGSILFFGDNFSGYCAGFDTRRGYAVIEIDPVDWRRIEAGGSFEEFIKSVFRRCIANE